METWMSALFWGLVGRRTMPRVMMLGLDGGGKTTILYKLKLGQVMTTIPTVGFNVENIGYRTTLFQLLDGGGQHPRMWKDFFQGTQGLIYVIDSADNERIMEAREQLHGLLKEQQLQDAPLLVLANKQDLPDAMNVADMTDKLDLRTIKHREWHIQSICATRGDGLNASLEWLVMNVK